MTAERLHVEVHDGDGPFLLLVHGMYASRATWLPNLDALGAVSRPVVVELWGHGRSPAPVDAERHRPEAYVEELERLRRELGCDRWLVCGASLGAALTLRYALDHPERPYLRKHPLVPGPSSRLPDPAPSALLADVELHDPAGLAAMLRHTIPASPVRDGCMPTPSPRCSSSASGRRASPTPAGSPRRRCRSSKSRPRPPGTRSTSRPPTRSTPP